VGANCKKCAKIYFALERLTLTNQLHHSISCLFSTADYRIPGLASDLYSKRETACGQQYVYTLSRCLVRRNQHDEFYECRIFCHKFLTHCAVQRLVQMQSTATLVPFFQPVLQILQLRPPAANNNNSGMDDHDTLAVPTPIRKFHRLRLSDGDFHMPATLSDNFNAMMEQQELKEKYVIQVLEFGVYLVHGTVGIHVIKANVVTTTPAYIFGDPVPLEQQSSVASETGAGMDESAAMQNLYKCQCPVQQHEYHITSKIPRTGWQVDAQGVEPAPEAIYIPDIMTSADRPIPRLLLTNSSSSPPCSSPLTVAAELSDDQL